MTRNVQARMIVAGHPTACRLQSGGVSRQCFSGQRDVRRRARPPDGQCQSGRRRASSGGPSRSAVPYGWRVTRDEALGRLRATLAAGRPIIGAGAGTGLSAKCEEAGGVDLIIVYNSGRYRMAGRGSAAGLLAYGDANAIVVEMAGEVLPVVDRHARARRRERHRPFSLDAAVPARASRPRLLGCAELPDRRRDRRELPPACSRRRA